jgi:hypothetical protein
MKIMDIYYFKSEGSSFFENTLIENKLHLLQRKKIENKPSSKKLTQQ